MWLFNRSSTPKSSKPVQRQISIRTRDEQGNYEEGQSYDPVSLRHGSPGALRSSFSSPHRSHHQMEEGIEDDETESTTSSDGHSSGRQPDVRALRNSSYSREPLDPRLWSNVTSPGFTTRAVHEANGNGGISPLREILSNRSPFSRSPNGHLKIGQLPIAAVPRRTASSLTNFPTPKGRSLFAYGRYSRIGKRDGKTGTVFVKLAPLDIKGAGPAVTPNTPSPGAMSMSASGVLSLPSFNETTSPGLGGMPQSGLTQRFSRLWPNMPHNTGMPLSPGYQAAGGSSNIVDVLTNRKRSRESEIGSDSKKIVRQASTPVSNPDEANKYPKRVKFVNDQEMRLNRPLTFDSYHDSIPNGNQPMTSILEQMNQTEKRFLPDNSLTSAAKKSKTMGSPPCGSSTPILIRKRRGNNGFSMVEEEDDEGHDDPKSKTGKFCHCNDCYREAAGMTSHMSSSPERRGSKNSAISPIEGVRKTVTFDETMLERQRNKSQNDKGTETDLQSKTEVVIRRASQNSGYITKDKYDYDRIKRLERFRRILGLPTPEEPTKDQVDGLKPATTGFSQLTTVQPQPLSVPLSTYTSTPITFSSSPISASNVLSTPSGEDVVSNSKSEFSSQIESQSKQEPKKDQSSLNVNFGSGIGQLGATVPVVSTSNLAAQQNLFSSSTTIINNQNSVSESGKSDQSGLKSITKPAEPEILSIFGIKKEESAKDQSIEFPTVDPGFVIGNNPSGSIVPTIAVSSVGALPNSIASNSGNLPNSSTFEGFKPSSQTTVFGSSASVTSQPIAFPNTTGLTSVTSNTTKTSPTLPESVVSASPSSFSFGGSQSKPGQFSFGQPVENPKTEVVALGKGNPSQTTPGGFNFPSQTQSSTVNGTVPGPLAFNQGTLTTVGPSSGFGSINGPSVTASMSSPLAQLNTFSNDAGKTSSEAFKSSSQSSLFGVTPGTSKPSTFSSLDQNPPSSSNLNQPSPSVSASTSFLGTSSFPGSGTSNTSLTSSSVFGSSQSNSVPGGFAFGQPQTQAAANSQPSVLSFGQTNQPQASTGAFTFSGQTQPSSGFAANPTPAMFNLPTTTAPTNVFGNANSQSHTTLSTPCSMNTVPQLNSFSSNSGNGISSNLSESFKSPNQPSPFSTITGNSQPNAFGSVGQNTTGTMNLTSSSASTPAFGSTSFAGAGASSASPFGGSQSNSGGFSFGQPQSQGGVSSQSGGLNFGQTSQPPSSGGFNFSSNPQPAFGTSPASGMFSLGSAPTQTAPGMFNIGSTATTTAQRAAFGVTNGPSITSTATMNSVPTQLNSFSSNSVNGINNISSEGFKPSPFGAASGTSQPNLFGSMGQNTSSSMNQNPSSTTTPAFGSSGFGGSGTSGASPAFNFGSSQPNSGGFAFGQSQPPPATNPQPGVFNFGQTSQPQSSPGGFNFAAQAPPAYGASPAPGMFNVGTSAAPRSRNARLRKYR